MFISLKEIHVSTFYLLISFKLGIEKANVYASWMIKIFQMTMIMIILMMYMMAVVMVEIIIIILQ